VFWEHQQLYLLDIELRTAPVHWPRTTVELNVLSCVPCVLPFFDVSDPRSAQSTLCKVLPLWKGL
jgi:hypothetical protein